MPILFITMPCKAEHPSPEEWCLLRQIREALDIADIGDMIGIGGGAHQMDVTIAVERVRSLTAFAKARRIVARFAVNADFCLDLDDAK